MNDRRYYSNYAESHDIDCFFRVGDVAYHFASNGQRIPDFILKNQNIEIQNAVYELLPNAKGACVVRWETIMELLNQELNNLDNNDGFPFDDRYDINKIVEDYAASFIEMARLGFVSMDVDDEGCFHIIAEPQEEISDNILKMLPEGQILW